MTYIAYAATTLSQWLDNERFSLDDVMSDSEWTMHRILKVVEESGEVYEAWHNYRGGNPRKLGTKSRQDVIDELLDTASAALAAVEHMTGNANQCTTLLEHRMNYTLRRVGLVK